MGRKRAVARGPRLKLSNYLARNLPNPPQSIDYSTKAMNALSPMYMNDQLGDCTSAAAFHIAGMLLANSNQPATFTDDQVTTFYSATSGYVKGNPNTDQGCDEQTVLNYWQQNGLVNGQHKIQGWVAVNAQDPIEVRTALWLFESLYAGVEMPDQWVSPMPSGNEFVWDVAGNANPDNGHAFNGVGFEPGRIKINTWGMLGWLTDAAIQKYVTGTLGGELYTVLSQDAIIKASQKAPNGFQWTSLLDDLNSIKA